ncbi:MAG: hypothetical protein HY741_22315 [Chloroflexi bacterium]|nr:hypothetical protein [Chloroflexota bacterium]
MRKAISTAIVMLALSSIFSMPSPAVPSAQAAGVSGPILLTVTQHDTSRPLRELIGYPNVLEYKNGQANAPRSLAIGKNPAYSSHDADGAINNPKGIPDVESMPAPSGGWDGINYSTSDCFCLPPDTNGDVGMNHYIQTVNTAFQIWDKNGNSVYGPAANNTLFSGFGGKCETTNDGDPVVLYDQLADRWFFSQFANVFTSGPYYQCIAVSATNDPTGSWYRYAVQFPKNGSNHYLLNDYGKFGVMPDGYYMTANLFDGTNFNWGGAAVLAFERQKMLNGQAAQAIYFNLGVSDWGGMLPADFDGTTLPPGNGNYLVEVQDQAWDPFNIPQDQMAIWKLTPDWANPANTSLTNIANLQVKKFNGILCNFNRNCVPQKGTSQKLDAISDRAMNRLQYRNFGSYETLVVNHTVKAKQRAALRWYEVRVTGGVPAVYQQNTFLPGDTAWRWMGSAAMDKQGNLAVGFSKSSTTRYPGIFYAGRLAADPLNSLAQGERRMKRGTGAQTSSFARWGDYSMLAVDPADDCTFWYTQEYYKGTSTSTWRTWIGKFKFPGCR